MQIMSSESWEDGFNSHRARKGDGLRVMAGDERFVPRLETHVPSHVPYPKEPNTFPGTFG